MTTTTNYGWTKPTVGGDSGSWGGEINDDLDDIDSVVKAVSDVANTALGTFSLGTSGWEARGSGLILQWGTTGTIVGGSNATVDFPIPFTTAVYPVTLTIISPGNLTGNVSSAYEVLGLTQMVIFLYGVNAPIAWTALGK